MEASEGLRRVAALIQLAVAPIFLLMAVATTLTVLVNRLSRIVDRARAVEGAASVHRAELASLRRRARLIYRALALGVAAATGVSLLMAIAFASQLLGFDAGVLVAGLFMIALFAYTAALLCLLREVFLALSSFRVGLGTSPAAPRK